jgi:translation elongation factor P/translation initiation factor 5A
MMPSKLTILAAGIAAVFASTAAHAVDYESAHIDERHAMYLTPDGKMKMFTINETGHAMMMKNARALAAGTIIYRNGGKLYVLEDKKMANGKMMFADMQSWTNDRLLEGAAGR